MSRFIDRTGEVYVFKDGKTMKIIKYYSYINCTVMFDDGVLVHNINYGCFKKGQTMHPNEKSCCGVGYFGLGSYKPIINGVQSIVYKKWYAMISRCYNALMNWTIDIND